MCVGSYSRYVGSHSLCVGFSVAMGTFTGAMRAAQTLCGLLQEPGGMHRNLVWYFNLYVYYHNLYMSCHILHVVCRRIYVGFCRRSTYCCSLCEGRFRRHLGCWSLCTGYYILQVCCAGTMWDITASAWAIASYVWDFTASTWAVVTSVVLFEVIIVMTNTPWHKHAFTRKIVIIALS